MNFCPHLSKEPFGSVDQNLELKWENMKKFATGKLDKSTQKNRKPKLFGITDT